MKSKISVWWEYTVILLFFIGGCNLFVYFKTAGLYDIFSDTGMRPFDPTAAHIKATVGGLLFGIKDIWFESRLYPWLSKHILKWQRHIVWAVCISIFIFSTVLQIHISHLMVLEGYVFTEAAELSIQFVNSSLFTSFLVHCFFLSMAVSFIRQLRINFGETVFLNYLLGKYSNPLVEKRSFMFLDLNDSTRIAENLGHVKYSRFLNKCFDDILDALKSFNFEVYQFVGDEVVLTWKIKDDTTGKAIDIYEQVNLKLLKEQDHYIKQFGETPMFKAGVSSGEVTATMVGKGSRHMAYHGDVLNTTARLLGQCKKLNKPLLFTDFYLKSLTPPLKFKPYFLSELKLQGKEQISRIYSPENINLMF